MSDLKLRILVVEDHADTARQFSNCAGVAEVSGAVTFLSTSVSFQISNCPGIELDIISAYDRVNS